MWRWENNLIYTLSTVLADATTEINFSAKILNLKLIL